MATKPNTVLKGDPLKLMYQIGLLISKQIDRTKKSRLAKKKPRVIFFIRKTSMQVWGKNTVLVHDNGHLNGGVLCVSLNKSTIKEFQS